MSNVTCTVVTQRGFVITIENDEPRTEGHAQFESVTLTDSKGVIIDHNSGHRGDSLGSIEIWVNLLNDPLCDPTSTDWEDSTKGDMGFLG